VRNLKFWNNSGIKITKAHAQTHCSRNNCHTTNATIEAGRTKQTQMKAWERRQAIALAVPPQIAHMPEK
jgi:hypothetical protein